MSLELPHITAPDDEAETAGTSPGGRRRRDIARARLVGILLPIVAFSFAIGLWEFIVRVTGSEPFILPAPSVVIATLIKDWSTLSLSLLVTLRTMAIALSLATFGGVLIAVIFAQSRLIERSLYPFAVILQVTPIVAIAPLILVYLDSAARRSSSAPSSSPSSRSCRTRRSASPRPTESAQPLQALWSGTLARAVLSARCRSALPYFLGGLAHRRRARAHRRGRRRDSPRDRPATARALPIASSNRATASTSRACSRLCFYLAHGHPRLSRCSRSSRIFCCAAGTKARSIGEGDATPS